MTNVGENEEKIKFNRKICKPNEKLRLKIHFWIEVLEKTRIFCVIL